jgi:hypothetical protein
MIDTATLRQQAGRVQAVVRINSEGMSHDDSVVMPKPAGNSFNWVLGHLLSIYNDLLPLLGQQPVYENGALKKYARGAPPITDPKQTMRHEELTTGWKTATERVDAGLASLEPERLTKPAPVSPTDNPNETIGSLLDTVMFHQAYHAGQLGVLRRIAGKPGAIK